MIERFDQAAATWDGGSMRQFISDNVFKTIASRIALSNNMNILDFGCGTGLLSFKVAAMVRSVTGVDLSVKMLEQLSSKNTASLYVAPLRRDIVHDPLDERFHGIVSSMAMHHVADTDALFRAFFVHLQRGGFIAIADLESEDGSFHAHGSEGVEHFGFNRDALRGIIENAGFANVRFHHACTVDKAGEGYPIFVVTASKP